MVNLKDQLLKKYPKLNQKTAELVIKKINKTPKAQRGKGFVDKAVAKAVAAYGRKKDDQQKLKDVLSAVELQGNGLDSFKDFLKKNSKMLLGVSAATIAAIAAAAIASDRKKEKDSEIKKPTKAFVFKDISDLSEDERKQLGMGDKPRSERPVRRPPRRTSEWVDHVRAYAKEHGLTYGESLKQAGGSYKK